MGPSGSGKTTLLDVLAGRKTAGKTTGSILFAGAPPTVRFLRRYTGYVEQFGEQQLAVSCAGTPTPECALACAICWDLPYMRLASPTRHGSLQFSLCP